MKHDAQTLSPRKRRAFQLIAVILPLAIIFAIGEVLLRRIATAERKKNEDAWAAVYAPHPPLQQGLARLMDLLQASSNPDIIYELRPNISVQFRGAQVTVNSMGFRGPGFSDDAANAFRIVAIGDSSLFGWGVNDNETYLSHLTRMLNDWNPHIRSEALNTGVPGYNTVMEVATLTNCCLHYKPDVVLVHHVVNDIRVPHFLTVQGGRSRPLNSYVLDWLVNRGRLVSGASDGLYMRDPKEIPEEYQAMVGEEACMEGFRELKRLSMVHDFCLVVCTDRQAPGYLKTVVDEIDVSLVELGVPSAQYMSDRGLKDPFRAGITLDEHDNHYSAFGHELIGEYLFSILKSNDEIRERMDTKTRDGRS